MNQNQQNGLVAGAVMGFLALFAGYLLTGGKIPVGENLAIAGLVSIVWYRLIARASAGKMPGVRGIIVLLSIPALVASCIGVNGMEDSAQNSRLHVVGYPTPVGRIESVKLSPTGKRDGFVFLNGRVNQSARCAVHWDDTSWIKQWTKTLANPPTLDADENGTLAFFWLVTDDATPGLKTLQLTCDGVAASTTVAISPAYATRDEFSQDKQTALAMVDYLGEHGILPQ